MKQLAKSKPIASVLRKKETMEDLEATANEAIENAIFGEQPST